MIEIDQWLLDEEQEYLRTDRIRYLDCLNQKPLYQRLTDTEIKDGLILYHHVYKFIVDSQNKSNT